MAWMIPEFMIRQIVRSQQRQLDSLCSDSNHAKRMSRKKLHAMLGDLLPRDGGKLLELGCGPGKYVAMLHSLGFQVVGIDPFDFPSWDALQGRSGITLMSGVRAENLPFNDGEFNHVVCIGALLYFERPSDAMKEILRVLRPGGHLLVRTVNRENLYTSTTGRKPDPASKNLYTMKEVSSLLNKEGFQLYQTFSHGFWPPLWTNLWWYLVEVWLPDIVQNVLSGCLPAGRRLNHILLATKQTQDGFLQKVQASLDRMSELSVPE